MDGKYGIWAVRNSRSVFGAAEDWCTIERKRIEFETAEQASDYAGHLNQNYGSGQVRYYPKKIKQD